MSLTPLFYVNLGRRFRLDEPPSGHIYVRMPNDKLVRRMERRNIMQHRKPNGNSIMHKLTKFRRELVALMPDPGLHPWQKRAEKQRRARAHAQVVMVPSGVSHTAVDAVLRPTNDGRGGVMQLDATK